MKTILVDALGTFVIEGQGVYQPLFDLLETYPNKKNCFKRQRRAAYRVWNRKYAL